MKFITFSEWSEKLSITEFESPNLGAVAYNWASSIDLSELDQSESDRKSLFEAIDFRDSPTELDGITDAWCLTDEWKDKMLLMTIFSCGSTSQAGIKDSFFTYFINVDGGTYISQIEATDLDSANTEWLSDSGLQSRIENEEVFFELREKIQSGELIFSLLPNTSSVYTMNFRSYFFAIVCR